MSDDTMRSLQLRPSRKKRIIEEVDAGVAGVVVPTVDHSAQGAFFLAGISVALIFLGWLAFYFLLFMPRGSVG